MLKKSVIAFSLVLLASSQSSFAFEELNNDKAENFTTAKNSSPTLNEKTQPLISTSLKLCKSLLADAQELLSLQTPFSLPKEEIKNSTIATSTQQIYDKKTRERLSNRIQSAQNDISECLQIYPFNLKIPY